MRRTTAISRWSASSKAASTPSRAPAETQAAVLEATERGILALGLTHGPVHAELRYNDAGPWILEIAARPIGGLCAQALRFSGGIPLEELLLRHAAGEDVAAATIDGERLSRKVVLTITDLTKEISGVRSLVAYEVDYTDGVLG